MAKEHKTMFRVSFYHTMDDTEPLAIIPIEAKMPLGALAFALTRVQLKTELGYVVVEHGNEQWEYFNVEVKGSQLHYQTVKRQT